MKRKIVFFLAIVLVLSGCKNIGKIFRASRRKAQPWLLKKREAPIDDVELAEYIVWPEPAKVSLQRDPFKSSLDNFVPPEDVEVSQDVALQLLGTSFSEDPLALIRAPGGTVIVGEQDKIGEVVVKEINRNRVVLERAGESIILEMEDESAD